MYIPVAGKVIHIYSLLVNRIERTAWNSENHIETVTSFFISIESKIKKEIGL
jgi:hypothetical protein